MSSQLFIQNVIDGLRAKASNTNVLTSEASSICDKLETWQTQEHRFITVSSARNLYIKDGLPLNDEDLFVTIKNLVATGRFVVGFTLTDVDDREDSLIQGEDYDNQIDILTGEEELVSPHTGETANLRNLLVYFTYIPR